MRNKTNHYLPKFRFRTARIAVLAVLAANTAGCASPQLQSGPPSFQQPAVNNTHVALSDGFRLPLSIWGPRAEKPCAVVLALHGFNDYRRAFRPLGTYLGERGIATYAYDQRGFGGAPYRGIWPGRQRLVQDALEVVQALQRRHPNVPVYLAGESMGGAVAIVAADKAAEERLAGVILFAPAVWGRATMSPFIRAALWLGVRTAPASQWTGEGLDIRPTDNLEVLRRMARDPLVIKRTRTDALWGLTKLMDEALARASELRGPALILYGRRDEIIPIAPTCRMLAALGPGTDATLVVYEHGYHLLMQDTRSAQVLRDVAAWLSAPQAELPEVAQRYSGDGARALLCNDGRG